MIEDRSLSGLSDADIDRRARSLYQQLARGVPVDRVEPMLTCLRALRAHLGGHVSPSTESLARARARVPQRVARVEPLQEQPLEALDVAALLRLRRALATTTPGSRGEAIAARTREIDRLLGATPRDYGLLRASVRQVQDWAIELGMADLSDRERRRTRRLLVAAWHKGVVVTNRIAALTRHEPARVYALEAYRALDRVVIERIQACVHPSPHIPREALREELEAWRRAHQDLEIPWPIEPTDEELDAAERAREVSRATVEPALTEVRWNYCPAVIPRGEP